MAFQTDVFIDQEPPVNENDWEFLRQELWVLAQKQSADHATSTGSITTINLTLSTEYSKADDGTADGQFHFWDDTNEKWTYTETSEMVWDDTNKRLGIGIDTPTHMLHVDGDFAVQTIDFKLSLSTPTHQEGRVYWDDDDKTLTAMMEVSGVSLQIGQEMHLRAKNESGAQIDNGKVVYISGASGHRPTIGLAKADSDATSNGKTIGLATHNISNNSTGYVTTSGYVRDVNTSAWAEGTSLYLSAATAGALTSTIPTAPNRKIKVGCVMYQHATEGIILVYIQDSREIQELHDVYVNSIADLHALVWDNGNSRWKNVKLDHTVHFDNVGSNTHAQIDTHIAGSALKHAASVITYDNSASGLSATEVQSAIDEIDGDLDTHIADVANPHATTWLLLGDTPSSYTNYGNFVPRVNDGPNAIEFSNLKVTNAGGAFVYDSGGTDYIQMTHDDTNAIITTNAGDLQLVPGASTDVSLFADSASGETRALELSGFRAGDSIRRTASFAIAASADDTLETTGLTYYTWDGNLSASGGMDSTVIGGNSPAAGTFTTVGATTVDTTNIQVTNIKAKDGTACATIANSTGVITVGSSVLTTTDINGGTIDGTTIGANSRAPASATFLGV